MENKDQIVEETPEEKPSLIKEILNFILYAAIVFGLTFFIITFIGQRTMVQGPSMYSTLENGDNLILEKVSYRFHDPKRFDIVVFRYAHADKTFYIKRVIGLPGETVQIIGEDIYINGEILEEDFGFEPIYSSGLASNPWTLGEDEYFVLGDNRNNSTDSRDPSVAAVNRKQIVGKAWLRIWPFRSFGFVNHK